jgi:RNA polymerase sigma factor (sigma-70 family)
MVFAIGVNILKSREDAEDVVQDIFAHKVGPLLEQNPGMGREEMGRYLAVMAKNLCIDRYRRRRRFPETELDPEIGLASGSGDEDGEARELAPLLDTLEPRYKEVLTLKYLLEMTWDEVALRLGLSQAGARKRADLAKKALAAEHGRRNAAESAGSGKGGKR